MPNNNKAKADIARAILAPPEFISSLSPVAGAVDSLKYIWIIKPM
jgi:hypothetical protein